VIEAWTQVVKVMNMSDSEEEGEEARLIRLEGWRADCLE